MTGQDGKKKTGIAAFKAGAVKKKSHANVVLEEDAGERRPGGISSAFGDPKPLSSSAKTAAADLAKNTLGHSGVENAAKYSAGMKDGTVIRDIKPELLINFPWWDRGGFEYINDTKLSELKDSIRDIGQTNPIIVRVKYGPEEAGKAKSLRNEDGKPVYEILSGHMRVEAIRQLASEKVTNAKTGELITTVRCQVLDYPISDQDAVRIMIDENERRAHVNFIMKGRNIQSIIDNGIYKDISEILAKGGVCEGRNTVYDWVNCGKINDRYLQMLDEDFDNIQRKSAIDLFKAIDFLWKKGATGVLNGKSDATLPRRSTPLTGEALEELMRALDGTWSATHARKDNVSLDQKGVVRFFVTRLDENISDLVEDSVYRHVYREERPVRQPIVAGIKKSATVDGFEIARERRSKTGSMVELSKDLPPAFTEFLWSDAGLVKLYKEWAEHEYKK